MCPQKKVSWFWGAQCKDRNNHRPQQCMDHAMELTSFWSSAPPDSCYLKWKKTSKIKTLGSENVALKSHAIFCLWEQPEWYEVTVLNGKAWASSNFSTPPLHLHLRPKWVLTLFWPENRFPNFIDLRIRCSTQSTNPTEISTYMHNGFYYVSSLWCRGHLQASDTVIFQY